MKKGFFKKLSVIAMACAVGLTGMFAGCTGGSSSDAIIDFGSLMPTANTTATVDNPEVIQASKNIINKYMQEKDVTLEWATQYGRSAGDSLDKTTSWYNAQINTNNCPIIGYTSLNMFQDLDYYVVLDEYLEKPNPYVKSGQPGSVKWKDMFYDYVWDDQSIKNVKGEIIAIPILLSVGTQSAYYYNKDLIAEDEIPTTWQDFYYLIEDLKGEGIEVPFVPYTGNTKPGLYQWALQFNIQPGFLKYMEDTLDYDGDGKVTNLEVLRGVIAGEFDPTVKGPAQDAYRTLYNFYKVSLDSYDWGSYDYTTNWANGKVAMWDNGLWNIPMENSNTGRKFEYGIFTPPLADSTTSDYCADLETYDSFDDITHPVSVAFNVMKGGVKDSQEKLDLAIDILMYITAQENNSAMAVEKGGTMGAVKGTKYNTSIDAESLGWKTQDFAKISYTCTWPTGYTAEHSDKINGEFEKLVNSNSPNFDNFYNTVKEHQRAGALEFIRIFNIDTTGWTGI